jgi:hypothetical protein
MPQRLVDGGAWATSKKLHTHVDEEYRLHYILWLTLAEANGSFECDVERIWATLYSYQMPRIKLRHVQVMLEQFKRAGALATWEDEQYPGKTFGYFIGNDKPGRLPPKAHLNRYKNLPPMYPGLVPDESAKNPEGFGVGLELDRKGKERKGAQAQPPSLPFVSSEEENRYMKAKDFSKKCVPIWQQIYGAGCILRYPERSKEELGFLTDTCDPFLLLEAFELWAKDRFAEGEGHDTWAISKFIKHAPDYMLKLRPANVNTARIDKQTALTNAALAEMGKAYGVDKPAEPEVPADYDPLAGVV